MKTKVVKIDPADIDVGIIKEAGRLIREGRLVAFPTETVYGLGANGLDAAAVGRIFIAKGRPSDNPLILHICCNEELDRLVKSVPPKAAVLIDRFWPGPMTLIFERSNLVPDAVTAGLDTVAVRMPNHPVAMQLIRHAGVPIAAPSANLSGRPSPTRADHVIDDLMGRVDMIIDGGPVAIGLESTVVDVTLPQVTVLRPGGVTLEQLQEAIGQAVLDPALESGHDNYVPRAPGMKYKHYAPEAEVIIVDGDIDGVVQRIGLMVAEAESGGKRVGVLATDQTKDRYKVGLIISAGDRKRPETIAARLFGILREFDKMGVDIIIAEAIDESGVGLAVMNRLVKSAGFNVINVLEVKG